MATLIFEYAAKFICGLQKDPEDLRLTLGLYGTEVNIHNPNEEVVRLTKKLALTFPPAVPRRPAGAVHHGIRGHREHWQPRRHGRLHHRRVRRAGAGDRAARHRRRADPRA